MLPPVDPEILSANPQFDALYRDLCTNKLEPDGTTKVDAKTQQERDAFKEDLRKARVAAAKQNLIKSYLYSLSYKGDDLPSEVRSRMIAVRGLVFGLTASRSFKNWSGSSPPLSMHDFRKKIRIY